MKKKKRFEYLVFTSISVPSTVISIQSDSESRGQTRIGGASEDRIRGI